MRGWSFDWIRDRWEVPATPWDLAAIVREGLGPDSVLLDLGTGGGEFLRSVLAALPARPKEVYATEGYAPNLAFARAELEPLGVRVLPVGSDRKLEVPDGSVDRVLARHEAFDAREVARVLRPGGRFVTQQVGGRNHRELSELLGRAPEPAVNRVDSAAALAEEVARAGVVVELAREAVATERVRDVGALVYFLRAAPWEVPGFSVRRFRPALEGIHARIERTGALELTSHRLLVVGRRGGPA